MASICLQVYMKCVIWDRATVKGLKKNRLTSVVSAVEKVSEGNNCTQE